MGTRSEQLRRRHRKILAGSLAGAALLHLAVFLLMPEFRADPLFGSDAERDTVSVVGLANASVEILFGPPIIRVADGSTWTEPPDRVLPAERGVRLEGACSALLREGGTPLRGRVRLRVRASGRVDVLGLPRGTGEDCGDRILREVAADLWYHWLPNERFPAPVDLVQPVTLVAAR